MEVLITILVLLGLLGVLFIGLIVVAFLVTIKKQIEDYRLAENDDD